MSDVAVEETNYQVVVETPVYEVVYTPSETNVVEVGIPGPPGVDGSIGPQGEQGPPGEDGAGDKTFSQSFTNATSQVVVHNLAKYPAIVFKDSAGTAYEVDIKHDSLNQCTVTWNNPTTGIITCN